MCRYRGMRRISTLLLLGLAIALPRAGAENDGWAQLRVGMSRAQTSAVLGQALMTSSGRGFDIAIYDGRAEVIFFGGRVVEWTAPASAGVPAPKGTWQFGRNTNARVADQAARQDSSATRPQTPRPVTLPVFIR